MSDQDWGQVWGVLSWVCAALALLPAGMAVANAWFFRRAERPASQGHEGAPEVTVCIPARNEAERIGPTLGDLQAQTGVNLTVLVGDDHSTDGTAELVQRLGQDDPRFRVIPVPSLPSGWSGKQHACYHLAGLVESPWVVFLDADVRLGPTALARLVATAEKRGVDLLSAFPRQQTGTVGEALLIPFIQFILMGFLPFFLARVSNRPSLAAGCGQLFLSRTEAYRQVGGHAVIRQSLHDGLHLPRAFRGAGFRTLAMDGSDVATCRMYSGWRETWQGLSKNAVDGMAAPASIGPFTVLLGLGQVLPGVVLLAGLLLGQPPGLGWFVAWGVSLANHLTLAVRFRQSLLGAVLHPLGMALLLLLQWTALINFWRGQPTTPWRGRSYPTAKVPKLP